ncbi:uncharacterized protein [Dysidea avara]|uniref:uncharacterized protein isoform X2 n=1 Tax=Dysidea avara TaxID=196820 RepID=UPI00331CA32A
MIMNKIRGTLAVVLLATCFPHLVNPADCKHENPIELIWSSTLRTAPFTSAPLLYDLDGDGYNDIVAANVAGEVWAVHGETGHVIDGWPFYLEDRSFHSTPLLYDVNGDGLFEIMVTTSDAELLFLNTDGSQVYGETIRIPALPMDRYWFRSNSTQHAATTKQGTISSLRGAREPGVDKDNPSLVHVDAHILATPVLVDLNDDGIVSELVIPVTYYYDPYQYSDAHRLEKLSLHADELVNFLSAVVMVMDIKQDVVLSHVILDTTKASSNQPAYLLATPTVVKLSPGTGYDIIIGSANGKLYTLSGHDLTNRRGFPITVDSITSQVAVHDITGDGNLNMIVGDQSGNVVCVNHDGTLLWEHEMQDPITTSVRFADMSGDGLVDVVIVTSTGSVWAVHGATGQLVENYPFHLRVNMEAPVLLLGLPTEKRTYILHVITVDMAGVVNVIEGHSSCRTGSEVGAFSYSGLLVDDFVPSKPGAELLVATRDGSLICVRSTQQPNLGHTEYWRSGQNLFTHKTSMFTVVPSERSLQQREVSGRHFSLTFHLTCGHYLRYKSVKVSVLLGNNELLHDEVVECSVNSSTYVVTSPTPPSPMHGTVTLRVCNEHQFCDHAYFDIKFNLHFQDNLKWCLLIPFVCMALSLLWILQDFGHTPLPVVHRTASTY